MRKSVIGAFVIISLISVAGCTQTDTGTVTQPKQNQAQGSECTPSWQCSSWGECQSNSFGDQQTRTCNDLNSCGIASGKPAETQSCTPKQESPPESVKHFTGNISQLALSKNDYPNFWPKQSEITDSNGLTGWYVSGKDKEDGWEGGYLVNYTSGPDVKNVRLFKMTQVILAFPVVNGVINSTYLSNSDEELFNLAAVDAYVNYNADVAAEPHKKYPPFGIGDKEFVYGFGNGENTTMNLYGIVFTKGNILEKTSIYGFGIDLDILKSFAVSASNKLSA